MLEYLYLARWSPTFDFLGSGSPPMAVRLAALNALFLALFVIRKAVGARPMGAGLTLFVQVAILGANLVVLYQEEVQSFLQTLTNRL
jgi:hypothetical protein